MIEIHELIIKVRVGSGAADAGRESETSGEIINAPVAALSALEQEKLTEQVTREVMVQVREWLLENGG